MDNTYRRLLVWYILGVSQSVAISVRNTGPYVRGTVLDVGSRGVDVQGTVTSGREG